jgi:hypothetical protein
MQTPAEKLAHLMLTRNGLAAIWDLQCAAGLASREGNSAAATSLLEIAEAATEEWLWRRRLASDLDCLGVGIDRDTGREGRTACDP